MDAGSGGRGNFRVYRVAVRDVRVISRVFGNAASAGVRGKRAGGNGKGDCFTVGEGDCRLLLRFAREESLQGGYRGGCGAGACRESASQGEESRHESFHPVA